MSSNPPGSKPKLELMFMDVFHGQGRPPRSGMTDLDPHAVNSGIAVLLAQAETLKRLRRDDDLKRKLLWAMAIANDCREAHPESALAMLNVARVARSAEAFDLAAGVLAEARGKADDETKRNIIYEEGQLAKEHDIAGGSIVAMAQRLWLASHNTIGSITFRSLDNAEV